MELDFGIAQGKPLRTLSLAGIDTKFFERNSALITKLLDERFEGEVSKIGLEKFLDALREGEHWLLLIDLDGNLLPFKKQRIASTELLHASLPCQQLLIVENESCQHQLPNLPGTIAILGAGFDLGWTASPNLNSKRIAYWGDIDTWGLKYLSNARVSLPQLTPLMMTQGVYEAHRHSAVKESIIAGTDIPPTLSDDEKNLYRFLLSTECGRLEQEFLSFEYILQQVRLWGEKL